MMFSGARSFFVQEVLTPELNSRAATGEIHPSGPLWGSGSGQAVGAAAELEGEVARELDDLRDGLERLGVEMARRPLRVIPADLRYEFSELDAVKLCFGLPSGAYATALLRELIGVDLSDRG
jgi:tRNA pseudouridine13 synthase